MEFRILGPVEVRRDGTRIPLAGTKIHTVLAALLLSRGRVVPDERISGFLWGWEPPTTLNAQIYTYVSRLRKQLGDEAAIARRQPGYVLEAGPDTSIDAVEFDRLDRLGRDALEGRHYAKASTLLTSALELWRGTPLANTTEHLAQAERPHWEEARSAALVARIQADMALGRHVHLVTELTRLVAEQPLSEQLRALLMTALYQGSRQADALAVYRTGCQILREELGIDPGPVLRRTHWQVLGGGEPEAPEAALSALLPPGAVTLGTATAPQESGRARTGASETGGGRGGRRTVPAMLPEDDTPFTGRAQHLAEIVYELRSASAHSARNHRVVVTGTPGVGRSALALRAARLLRPHFPDGQLYASLGGPGTALREPADVLGVFLRALGLPAAEIPLSLTERTRRYRSLLAGRRVLVVLDDADDETAVRSLLPEAPYCRAILTARSATTAGAGIRLVRLQPMGVAESTRLLGAYAGAARVAAEPEAAMRIAALCDGQPLALRIAGERLAARPAQPLAELAAALAPQEQRLDVLRHGPHDLRAALRTMLAPLPPEARHTLNRLARLPRPDFSAARAGRVLTRSERETEAALEHLADLRVLDVVGVAEDRRLVYRLSPLVRLCVVEDMAAEAEGVAPGARPGGTAGRGRR